MPNCADPRHETPCPLPCAECDYTCSRIGKVTRIELTRSGYQTTTIDGEKFLTLFDGQRVWPWGKVVRFIVGDVPEGWTLPTATVIEVLR